MANIDPDFSEPTAVNDVRRVREKIAREHGGDLHRHVEETNRIAAEIRARLKVNVVPAHAPVARRAGIGG